MGLGRANKDRCGARGLVGIGGRFGHTTRGRGRENRTLFAPSPGPRQKEANKVLFRRLCLVGKRRELKTEMQFRGVGELRGNLLHV